MTLSPVVRVLLVAWCLLLAGGGALARAQTMPVFNTGTGANDVVFAVSVQADGRILVGGRFTMFDGVPRSGVARLNADGSLDPSLDPGSGTVGSVYFVGELPNGQILLGGDFTSYDGTARGGVARLNADGTLDPAFDPGSGADGGTVFRIAGQVDGKLLVGGRFTTFDGVARGGVARLNADGSLDRTFDPGEGINGGSGNGTNGVYDVVVQPDGRILLGGFFNRYDGTLQPGIVRVNTDGSIDPGFATGSGVGRNNTARTVALQGNGKIIVGGNFTRFSDVAEAGIVRLNVDGSIDPTFDTTSAASGRSDFIYAVAVQPDGKIVAGGDASAADAAGNHNLVRFNSDGSLDGTFNALGGSNGTLIDAVTQQADGGILVGGNFSTVGGAYSPGVARLDATGRNEAEAVVTIRSNLKRIGAGEAGTVATVTLTRTGNLTQGLEVFYKTGGAAVSAVDYQPLSGRRKIKAGRASVSFRVIAKQPEDATAGTVLPVKIVLLAGDGYTVGSVPPFVKIKIVH